METIPKILIATDQREVAKDIQKSLEDNYALTVVEDATEVLATLRAEARDIVLLDPLLKGLSSRRLINRIVQKHAGTPILLLVDEEQQETAQRLSDLGIEEVVIKPISPERLRIKVKSLIRRHEIVKKCGLVGRSEGLVQIAESILQIAPTTVTVLIQGESGTGKELVARAIHNNSPRKDGPFIPVNCGALAEGVLESELFGHERGAFTGAVSQRKGMFELAAGGTILLDEVGELSSSTQVKLLRVLEEREFMRVGGRGTIETDARVVAASNRELGHLVAQGKFRRDLYYRLNVVTIDIPPLRERREDILPLVYEFIAHFSRENDRETIAISEAAMRRLINYNWPGNVRELRNFVESVAALSPGKVVEEEDVLAYLNRRSGRSQELPVPTGRSPETAEHQLIYQAILGLRADIIRLGRMIEEKFSFSPGLSLRDGEYELLDESSTRETKTLSETERELISRTLREMGGNRRKAAKALGIGERTLYRKIEKYDLANRE